LTAYRSSRIFPFEEKGVFKSLFPAQIPVKNNPQANEAAFAQVRADKAGVSLCS